MDLISGQSSPVCAEPCGGQRIEVTDRTLLGLALPLILVTEALAAYRPILTSHCLHTHTL